MTSNSSDMEDDVGKERKLIDAVLLSTTRSERVSAVERMLTSYNHNDEHRHDSQCKMGGIAALCKNLSYCMRIEKGVNSEICKITRALTLINGCSRNTREMNFEEHGEILLDLILDLMERCFGYLTRGEKKDAISMVMKNVTTLILLFSRCSSKLRSEVAQNDLLLKGFLDVVNHDWSDSTIRATALGCFNNLACTESLQIKIAKLPLLLDTLVEIVCMESKETIRKNAFILIFNLSWAKSNLIDLGKRDKLLHALAKALSDEIVMVKSSAVRTIRNLAKDNQNAENIEKYMLTALINFLLCNNYAIDTTQTAAQDKNKELKRLRSMITWVLKWLSQGVSIHVMAQQKNLLQAINDILSSTAAATAPVEDDEHRNVSTLLVNMSIILTHHQKQIHPTFLDCLVKLSRSTTTAHAAAEQASWAFLVQSSIQSSTNVQSLATHERVLETLVFLASQESVATQVRSMACLLKLSKWRQNKVLMSKNKAVLTILVTSSTSSSSNDEVKPLAIRILINLASHVGNRKRLAKHEGVIIALAGAATPHPDYILGAKRALMHLLNYERSSATNKKEGGKKKTTKKTKKKTKTTKIKTPPS